MTINDLDTLGALGRRLSHAEAITRLAAENRNDPDDVRAAIAGVSTLIKEANRQLGELIVAQPQG